jgi:hypothetical protein
MSVCSSRIRPIRFQSKLAGGRCPSKRPPIMLNSAKLEWAKVRADSKVSVEWSTWRWRRDEGIWLEMVY